MDKNLENNVESSDFNADKNKENLTPSNAENINENSSAANLMLMHKMKVWNHPDSEIWVKGKTKNLAVKRRK